MKNDVYDVIQPRRERKREATMEECERAGTGREGMGSRISMESRTRRGRRERNESSLSPGKMKNTFHAVINVVDSGED